MPSVAKIFLKGTSDNTLILNTRCQCIYPFSAPNWTDLRVGFLLSLTQTAADDTIGTLAETLPTGDFGHPQEIPWIGIKTNNDALPLTQGVGFIGYSTYAGFAAANQLVSSDEGIGTSNTYFWRPKLTTSGSAGDNPSALIADGATVSGGSRFTNVQPHFLQDPAHATAIGYATLLMLRITRPSGTSKAVTVQIKQGTNSGDVLFTNTPTLDLLETNLANYPSVVQTKTLNNMVHIPDAIYAYWPYHNSRLRIHNLGFQKAR